MKKHLVVLFEGEKYKVEKGKRKDKSVCFQCVLHDQCMSLLNEGNCFAHVCVYLIGDKRYFARDSKDAV